MIVCVSAYACVCLMVWVCGFACAHAHACLSLRRALDINIFIYRYSYFIFLRINLKMFLSPFCFWFTEIYSNEYDTSYFLSIKTLLGHLSLLRLLLRKGSESRYRNQNFRKAHCELVHRLPSRQIKRIFFLYYVRTRRCARFRRHVNTHRLSIADTRAVLPPIRLILNRCILWKFHLFYCSF